MWYDKYFCDIVAVLSIMTRLTDTSPSFVFNQPTAALQRIKHVQKKKGAIIKIPCIMPGAKRIKNLR